MECERVCKRRIILDTDPGVDDALAIILAMNSSELEVVGITTVHGNVSVDLGTSNAIKVLGLLQRLDVPVYRGSARPLVREPVHATEVHGEHGLGDAALPDPGVEARGDAIRFLVDAISGAPGKLTVVSLGPLTNLAQAEQAAPGLLRMADEIITMGGAIEEPGNVTPAAEFNFFADPEAARVVIGADANLTLVPLDVTHQTFLEGDFLAALAEPEAGPLPTFVALAVAPAVSYSAEVYGTESFYLHDPLAVAVAAQRSVCGYERKFLDVETSGELTSGQVVADIRPFADCSRSLGHPTECATSVDRAGFLDIFRRRVLCSSDSEGNV